MRVKITKEEEMKWIGNDYVLSCKGERWSCGKKIGKPKRSKVYTVKELEDEGWVGVYEPWLFYVIRRVRQAVKEWRER